MNDALTNEINSLNSQLTNNVLNLTANMAGTEVLLDSYDVSNPYMFPTDGYINFKALTASSGYFEVAIVDKNGNNLAYKNQPITGAYESDSYFVRSGTYCIIMTLAQDAHVYYVPLVN